MKLFLFFLLHLQITNANSSFVKSPNVNQVELQWSVCGMETKDLLKLFSKVSTPTEKQASYFDTCHLNWAQNEVEFRVRDGSKRKSTVKAHFNSEAEIPWEFLKDKDFKCEYDDHITQRNLACSLNFESEPQKIWSKEQAQYLINLGFRFSEQELLKHGPYKMREWNVQINKEDLVVDSVTNKAGQELIEISIRVSLEEEIQVGQKIARWISDNFIPLCAIQGGRAKSLLE